jgi:hypothetical protein
MLVDGFCAGASIPRTCKPTELIDTLRSNPEGMDSTVEIHAEIKVRTSSVQFDVRLSTDHDSVLCAQKRHLDPWCDFAPEKVRPG